MYRRFKILEKVFSQLSFFLFGVQFAFLVWVSECQKIRILSEIFKKLRKNKISDL